MSDSDNNSPYGAVTIVALVIVVIGLISSSRYLLRIFRFIPQPCTVDDIYEVGDFSECNENNFRVRDVVKRNNINCSNPGSVEKPDEKVECEYIPECTEENLSISDWSICSESSEGFTETRQIQKKSADTNCKINYEKFPLKQRCKPTVSTGAVILKDYTTEVDPTNQQAPYKPSRDNLQLEFKGQFKSMKLIVTAITSYKIPEYYYFQFEINEEIPRTIGATKTQSNRLDLSDYGIFKGTETPAKREFELSNVEAANVEGAGSQQVNYLNRINNRSSDILYGSLYVGDGRSMIVEDPKNRIYATVTEAIVEYECAAGSECSVDSLN